MAKRLVYAEILRDYSASSELVFALQTLNRTKREDGCWTTISDLTYAKQDDKKRHSMSNSAEQSNERKNDPSKHSSPEREWSYNPDQTDHILFPTQSWQGPWLFKAG